MRRNAKKLSVVDPLDPKWIVKYEPVKLNRKAVWTPDCVSLFQISTSTFLSFLPIQKEAKDTAAAQAKQQARKKTAAQKTESAAPAGATEDEDEDADADEEEDKDDDEDEQNSDDEQESVQGKTDDQRTDDDDPRNQAHSEKSSPAPSPSPSPPPSSLPPTAPPGNQLSNVRRSNSAGPRTSSRPAPRVRNIILSRIIY